MFVLPKVRNSSNNSLCYENGVFEEDNYKIKENDKDKDKIIKKGNIENNTKNGDRRIVDKEILFLEKLNILKKKVILEIINIFDHEAMDTECINYNEMSDDEECKAWKFFN